MPQHPSPMAEYEKALRDGAYVAVGLGVLAFQRAQVERRQVAKRIEERRREVPSFDRLVADVQDASVAVGARLEELTTSLSANAGATRAQLRSLARSWDNAVAPARRRIDERAQALESLLPSPAREVVAGVRAAAAVPEARLRAAAGLD